MTVLTTTWGRPIGCALFALLALAGACSSSDSDAMSAGEAADGAPSGTTGADSNGSAQGDAHGTTDGVAGQPDHATTGSAEAAGGTDGAPSATGDASSNADAPSGADRPGWNLVFSDEFEGASGTAVDATNWNLINKGGGFGNNELEFYTNRTDNAALDGNGSLVIKAMKEAYMGSDYTSARLESSGKFEQAYGRFESRIKLPRGQGIWPAFWVLGANITPRVGPRVARSTSWRTSARSRR